MRSRKKAPMLPPLYRRGSPCIDRLPADHARPDPVRTASRGPLKRPAGHCPACITTATTWNATRWPHRPPGSAAAQLPVPGDDRGPIAVAHSGGCPARRGGASKAIPAGQNQAKAPPCMRWRGLTRPRRTGWPVARPCSHSAPPAGARYPCEGTGLPAPPTFPGSPPGGARFRTVRTFLLPQRAPRKSPRPSHFRFSRYPRRNPRKAGSYPHFTAVIHGLAHSLSTGYRV
jgi:hypothetical protein